METLLAICLGITLSAACGFRIFLPPLVLSIAAVTGHGNVTLAPEFAWVGTKTALIALAIATAIEIFAYYIPFVDNLLDTIEIPTALAMGTMLTSASLGEVDPLLRWTIAVLAGATAAETVQAFTSITRLASSGITAGSGNFLVSTTEALSATVLSILAITVPLLAAIILLLVLSFAVRKIWSSWRKRRKLKTRRVEEFNK